MASLAGGTTTKCTSWLHVPVDLEEERFLLNALHVLPSIRRKFTPIFMLFMPFVLLS
jgi:hypothetical protein